MDETVREELGMKDIILLVDSLNAMKELPDKDAGALIKAIIRHVDGEEPERLPKMAAALYPLIRGQVDRISDIHEKRVDAGRRGGEAKAKQNGSKTVANAKQSSTPLPLPLPLPERDTEKATLQRSKKIQNAYGFSTERPDVNYDDIIRERLRKERAE